MNKKPEILLNKGKQASFSADLNYFARAGNIYIMDNHLAAIWCWEKLPKDKTYTLLHIDAHYDLGCSPPGRFLYGKLDLREIPLADLVSIDTNERCPYFLWDNYIHLFNDKYPGRIKEFISITHQIVQLPSLKKVKIQERNIWHLISGISYDPDNVRLLNLDIDYFFEQETKTEIFSDQIINLFANWLAKNQARFEMITIALSPECCGSWENAIDMANRILKPLKLKINL